MRLLFALLNKVKIFTLLVLLAPWSIQASEFAANFSGFATYTAFSNQSWFENEGRVAQNVSLHYGDFAFKTQIANQELPIRRAALEYSRSFNRSNILVQMGRVPRLNTFFSDIHGNPDEWGMAVLPLSTYNRRKVHSLAFNALDGIKLQGYNYNSLGSTTVTMNWGTLVQEYPCEYQMEALRKPCNPGWLLLPKTNDSGDIAIEHVFNTHWAGLISYNKVSTKTALVNPLDPVSVLTTRNIAGVDYRFTRIGLRYTKNDWYAQTEHGESRLYMDTPKGVMTASTAWDDYYLVGYYFNDQLSFFGGYSRGHERGSLYTSRDRFTGAAYRDGRWAYTLELHDGNGTWQKPGSALRDWNKQVVGSMTVNW